eukprot:scaffold1973_cov399-Prasinococcus_capsulatus_cf.AAC.26
MQLGWLRPVPAHGPCPEPFPEVGRPRDAPRASCTSRTTLGQRPAASRMPRRAVMPRPPPHKARRVWAGSLARLAWKTSRMRCDWARSGMAAAPGFPWDP